MVGANDGTHTFVVCIAQGPLSHIRKLDGSLGAGIHKPITTCRVELSSRNHLCQLLHVCRFDINNVETLILNVQVPEVDSKVVTADKGLAVTVDGDTVDVVCMGVGVGSSGYCSNNGVVMRHPWELQG